MNEFTINVTLKENRGAFGIKRGRHTFSFCAKSRGIAVELACSNVPCKGFPYETREIQIVSAVSVFPDLSDECRNGGCEDCNFLWCRCDHHSVNQFRKEHPQIRSLVEIQSERDEMEAA